MVRSGYSAVTLPKHVIREWRGLWESTMRDTPKHARQSFAVWVRQVADSALRDAHVWSMWPRRFGLAGHEVVENGIIVMIHDRAKPSRGVVRLTVSADGIRCRSCLTEDGIPKNNCIHIGYWMSLRHAYPLPTATDLVG